MIFKQNFQTTHIGSLPHNNLDGLCEQLIDSMDIPAWPQLPRRTFYESMYVQCSHRLPGVVIDEAAEKVFFDTSNDLSPHLEAFYEGYLDEDIDAFALPPRYADGFYTMLKELQSKQKAVDWVKGQVTGPISLGLTVTDQDLRASLYHDLLGDVIVKNSAMNARWQIRQLHTIAPNVIVFIDEPYMASFGSAFISLSREQVITMLDEVFDAIHAEGALAGVHCCANTDWSVLLETSLDILNLDAYGYIENLALYPAELHQFLDRGGIIAWGLIPNSADIMSSTPEKLARHLQAGMELISQKAQARAINISANDLAKNCLITPSCGLGSATAEVADQVLRTLSPVATILRRQ